MQEPTFFAQTRPVALYVHIPFCERKCPYCDFNSYAGFTHLYDAFTEALEREIRAWGERLGRPVLRSVFLGGGTPTVLALHHLEVILRAVYDAFSLSPQVEISVEANPGTTDRPLFKGLRDVGVNRLSLGAQSFRDEELTFLGRIHTAADILHALEEARRVGFENVNLDLIYGLPAQPLSHWQGNVRRALELAPEHLSCYALTVESGTPLARWVAEGRVPPPDDDVQGEMYEWTREALERAGYVHYEISNWARPGRMSVHNRVYWQHEPYLGVGPGAHSFDGTYRWWNLLSPQAYVRRLTEGRSPVAGWEHLSTDVLQGEMMILGLRLLVEGVDRSRFFRRFGRDPVDVFSEPLQRFQRWGLVRVTEDRILLTPRAYAVANRVFQAFLPATEGVSG